MRLIAIIGPRHNTFCRGCNKRLFADEPQELYAELSAACTPDAVYCPNCAVAMVYEDPTRSVTRFYADTNGTQVDYKRIKDERPVTC